MAMICVFTLLLLLLVLLLGIIGIPLKIFSEKVVIDNIEYQMEPKPKELKDMWLNGEYLFVKIENGFANTWVQ